LTILRTGKRAANNPSSGSVKNSGIILSQIKLNRLRPAEISSSLLDLKLSYQQTQLSSHQPLPQLLLHLLLAVAKARIIKVTHRILPLLM
jgi:hypothetical protein